MAADAAEYNNDNDNNNDNITMTIIIAIIYGALTSCQMLLSPFLIVLHLIFTTTTWDMYYNFIKEQN